MPIDRKTVEDYFEEQEKEFKGKIKPITARVLKILSRDSQKLYSVKELRKKIGLADSCCGEEACECSECPRYLVVALKILLEEEKITISFWPQLETGGLSPYFGIKEQ